MAILFYEGLPRSGKSYEAMSTLVIPWLQKGKEVVAYIEGLDEDACRQRICEASGLDRERVDALLFALTREDMRPRTVEVNGKQVQIDGTWIEKTRDNALHVLDEAQNWWPNRLRATEALTQFVTEHGHRGITILLMGQSLKDVLALWRRRVDQKMVFLKLSAVGRKNNYRVTTFKGQGDDVYVKVGDTINKYDPKYFGTYKSHVSGETDAETYTDKRANVFRGAAFTYGIPLTIALLGWGGWTAWKYFHPAPVPAKAVATASPGQQIAQQAPQIATVKAEAAPDLRSPQERYFAELGGKYRIRLAGMIEGRGNVSGLVEWLDGNTRVVERLSLDQLRDLGVVVLRTRDVVRLTLGEWNVLATMWPVEAEGRVSESRQETIRGPREPGSMSPEGVAPGLVVIADGRAPPSPPPAAPLEQAPTRQGFRRPAGS